MAFVLLTTLTAGCDTDSTGTDRPVHCEVIVDAPEKAEDRDVILATVRFNCDKPGAEPLILVMHLEKRDGENWHTVSSKTHTVRGLDTNAKAFDHQSRSVELKCASGTYRTVVDWTRDSRGASDGDNLVSGVAKDPCNRL
jgi:hypothetical protein